MPSIRFHCPNGHALQVEGALAGQQGKCPQCGRVVRVPPPNAGSEPPADETAATPPPPPPAAAPPTAPTERAVWYLRTNAGDQFGPATDAALRQWIMGGRVGHASYVWREGWAEWRTAADASEELPAPLPPQAPPAARGDPNREGSAAARYARRKRKNTVARSVVACVLLVLTMCLGGLLLYLLVSEQAKPVERDEYARQPAGAAVAPPAAPPDADAKPNAPGSAEAERGQRGAAGDRGGTGAAADDQADGPPNDDPFGLGDPLAWTTDRAVGERPACGGGSGVNHRRRDIGYALAVAKAARRHAPPAGSGLHASRIPYRQRKTMQRCTTAPRTLTLLAALAATGAGAFGAPPTGPDADTPPMQVSLANGALRVEAPGNWKQVRPRSRIVEAELAIPAEAEGAAPGRLTIMAAGGSVKANLDRWKAQFKGVTQVDSKEMDVNGMKATLFDATGTFLESKGPFFGPKVERPGYRMLGAIVQTGGEGTYFFKLTGPAKLLQGHADAFQKMVASVEKK